MADKRRRAGESLMRAVYRTRLLGEVGKAIAWIVTIWHVARTLAEMLRDQSWLK